MIESKSGCLSIGDGLVGRDGRRIAKEALGLKQIFIVFVGVMISQVHTYVRTSNCII